MFDAKQKHWFQSLASEMLALSKEMKQLKNVTLENLGNKWVKGSDCTFYLWYA